MRIYIYLGHKVSGRGGTERAITSLSNGLKKKGHDIRVILTEASEYTNWEKSHVVYYVNEEEISFSKEIALMYKDTIGLINLFRKLPRPDIVIGVSDCWNVATLRVVVEALNIDSKVLSWLHFSMHYLTELELLHFADAHLVICEEIKKQYTEFGISSAIEVVYNAVDLKCDPISRATKNKFLYVGRLANEQKRVDKLLRALVDLNGDWELLVIGEGEDEYFLKELSKNLGLYSKINWLGWNDSPWDLISEATALILPSDFEGFGLVLIEALARGIPVIASDCLTGPKEIVEHGVNGWLFEPDSIEQLSAILQNIIAEKVYLPSPEVCKSSVIKFDESRFINNYEKILQDILKEVKQY